MYCTPGTIDTILVYFERIATTVSTSYKYYYLKSYCTTCSMVVRVLLGKRLFFENERPFRDMSVAFPQEVTGVAKRERKRKEEGSIWSAPPPWRWGALLCKKSDSNASML